MPNQTSQINFGFAENLALTTARILAKKGDKNFGVGTGFFYAPTATRIGPNDFPLLVTNKHVVEGADSIELSLTQQNSIGLPQYGHRCTAEVLLNDVVLHPDPSVDLCAIAIGGYINEAKKQGITPACRFIRDEHLVTADPEHNIGALRTTIMVGYPEGIHDERNNVPIFRRGSLASHFFLNCNGKQDFLVDIPVFPGSSGSPILIDPTALSHSPGMLTVGSKEPQVLGVLYSGFTSSASGTVQPAPVPTTKELFAQIRVMANLGCCLKAVRIKELGDHVGELLNKLGPSGRPDVPE